MLFTVAQCPREFLPICWGKSSSTSCGSLRTWWGRWLCCTCQYHCPASRIFCEEASEEEELEEEAGHVVSSKEDAESDLGRGSTETRNNELETRSTLSREESQIPDNFEKFFVSANSISCWRDNVLNILCFTKTTLVHDNTFDIKMWDLDLIENGKLRFTVIFQQPDFHMRWCIWCIHHRLNM